METITMTNDTIIKYNCDNITDINANPTANIISTTMIISDENSNSSCTIATINEKFMATTDDANDQCENDADDDENDDREEKRSYETIINKRRESIAGDTSLMSCSSDEEVDDDDNDRDDDDKKHKIAFDSVNDNEERNEIFYDSTNESGDYEREQNDNDNEKKTTPSYLEEDCGLSKLYLNDIEIDSKEEEQTVTELVNAAEKEKLMQV